MWFELKLLKFVHEWSRVEMWKRYMGNWTSSLPFCSECVQHFQLSLLLVARWLNGYSPHLSLKRSGFDSLKGIEIFLFNFFGASLPYLMQILVSDLGGLELKFVEICHEWSRVGGKIVNGKLCKFLTTCCEWCSTFHSSPTFSGSMAEWIQSPSLT